LPRSTPLSNAQPRPEPCAAPPGTTPNHASGWLAKPGVAKPGNEPCKTLARIAAASGAVPSTEPCPGLPGVGERRSASNHALEAVLRTAEHCDTVRGTAHWQAAPYSSVHYIAVQRTAPSPGPRSHGERRKAWPRTVPLISLPCRTVRCSAQQRTAPNPGTRRIAPGSVAMAGIEPCPAPAFRARAGRW
jgi:hypothetical protein